ncbi:hypothetical protein PIB30_085909 [Stylosanthes scabra]|uniref:Uncharacterized protein n=1 Tax=Stylosanthes scabra TaxID=79078 RepID=A0ABU6YQI7_9FABA|nr:hypothetical protein [Stylosanthes scabra]
MNFIWLGSCYVELRSLGHMKIHHQSLMLVTVIKNVQYPYMQGISIRYLLFGASKTFLKKHSKKSSDGRKDQDDQKKSKVEENQDKSTQTGEAPKENFIDVRARRGQATYSHSLA